MPARNLIAGATRRLLPAAALSLVLVVPFGAATADAATTFTTYAATLSGQHGTAKLTTFTSTTGSIQVAAKALAPGAWSETIYRGTCSSRATTSRHPAIEILNPQRRGALLDRLTA